MSVPSCFLGSSPFPSQISQKTLVLSLFLPYTRSSAQDNLPFDVLLYWMPPVTLSFQGAFFSWCLSWTQTSAWYFPVYLVPSVVSLRFIQLQAAIWKESSSSPLGPSSFSLIFFSAFWSLPRWPWQHHCYGDDSCKLTSTH